MPVVLIRAVRLFLSSRLCEQDIAIRVADDCLKQGSPLSVIVKARCDDNRFSQFIRERQSLNDLSGITDYIICMDLPQHCFCSAL